MASTIEPAGSSNVYERLEAYDWDNDPEFQGGLQAILGSASSPDQIRHLTLRARCFYYSRKIGQRIDFQGYLNWLVSHNGSVIEEALVPESLVTTDGQQLSSATGNSIPENQESVPSPHGNAPTPASFAEICEMIAQGKPIPGIKDIPDTVLEGQGTQSGANVRKKPWERDATIASVPSWQNS